MKININKVYNPARFLTPQVKAEIRGMGLTVNGKTSRLINKLKKRGEWELAETVRDEIAIAVYFEDVRELEQLKTLSKMWV